MTIEEYRKIEIALDAMSSINLVNASGDHVCLQNVKAILVRHVPELEELRIAQIRAARGKLSHLTGGGTEKLLEDRETERGNDD